MQLVTAKAESKRWSPVPDVIITIKLNLHSKKQDCNSGFGFCKISININFGENANPGMETVNGKAFINEKNQLVIKLNETDIKKYENGSTFQYLNGKNSVYVDADYELTSDVSKALGSLKPVVIKEGTYRLTLDQGIYTLLIPQ